MNMHIMWPDSAFIVRAFTFDSWRLVSFKNKMTNLRAQVCVCVWRNNLLAFNKNKIDDEMFSSGYVQCNFDSNFAIDVEKRRKQAEGVFRQIRTSRLVSI